MLLLISTKELILIIFKFISGNWENVIEIDWKNLKKKKLRADQICDSDSKFVEKMKQSSGCSNDAFEIEVDDAGHVDSVVGLGVRFGLARKSEVQHPTHTTRIAEGTRVNLGKSEKHILMITTFTFLFPLICKYT